MNKKLVKSGLSILVWSMAWLPAIAQNGTESSADPYFYDRLFGYGLALLAATVMIAAFIAIVNLLNIMVRAQQNRINTEAGISPQAEEAPATEPGESIWSRLYQALTDRVPIEKEEEILFDHSYDGIRELDNSLPPWWLYMFYISIAFSVGYLVYYHVGDWGMSSEEAYAQEMQEAEEQVKAYLASQSNRIDETNVAIVTAEDEIALGQAIYQANCLVCHGAQGEGGVGPNLTDPYWINGGSIKDIFMTIKYGVPEKGMIAWQAQLRPVDMQRVASYITTLQGTDPPNAKEPEGELYQAEETPSDSVDTSASIGMR
ncbi:MAG: cbb3-type cytochrome c oxidase N-terminal domain-containing protein [Saprospiraceae bacterium]|nr:cbb3-type cytochrome c oxidase N-terminal domain-containing protein [Saprospiraceae bacterium]